MKKLRKICIITDDFPTSLYPKYPFVEQLVIAFTKRNIECTVLNPESITRSLIQKIPLKPIYWEKEVDGGTTIKIYCPRYISYSSKKIGFVNTAKYTLSSFERCCMKFFRENRSDFDAVYGHFIYPSGIVASKVTEKYGIPSFVAYGENTTYTIDYLGENKTRRLLKNISGVISVSNENKRILVEKKIISPDKISVFPNGVDTGLFFKRSREEMRKKYGLPLDEFIVIFVGRFVEIKGAHRLSKAIELVGTDRIKSIFIGSGNIGPTCDGVLIKGSQPHDRIPELLSCADIFVLPTLAEGCCNAIIEAMACGLPVISSKGAFNDDILDDTCSIRVDPNNILDIANAIEKLYKDKHLRDRLSEGALIKAMEFNIENRAMRIIDFIESKISG